MKLESNQYNKRISSKFCILQPSIKVTITKPYREESPLAL